MLLSSVSFSFPQWHIYLCADIGVDLDLFGAADPYRSAKDPMAEDLRAQGGLIGTASPLGWTAWDGVGDVSAVSLMFQF